MGDGGGGSLEAKIEALLNVEKQMRQIGDVAGTRKAVTDIVQLCFEAGAWQTLNEQIQLISKRRGQLKQVVQSMVQQAMQFIDQTPDLDTKIELIKTLNSVSAGKVDIEGSLKVKRMEPKTRQEVKGHDGGGDCLEAKIEALLNVEKQMRQIGDVAGTRKAVTDIMQLCFEAGAWQTLNEQIQLISKRRGQLKQVVQSMVQQAMQFIDQTPDLDTKIELIKILNNVSAGKVDIECSLKVKRMEPKTRQEVKGHDGGGDCLEAKIEALLNVEKQMRQIGDVAGTRKAVTDIVQLCFEAGAWQTLNEQIQLISKRRGQLKQVVQSMVQQAMQFIDQTPDLDTKIELIKTLNNVSAGKVDIEGSFKVKRMEPKTRQEVKVDSQAPADDTKSEVTPKTPLGKGGKLKKGEVSTLEKGSSSSPKGRKKERNSSSSSSSSGGFRVKRRIKLPLKKKSRFVVMEPEDAAHRAPQRTDVGQLIHDLGHGARPRRRF